MSPNVSRGGVPSANGRSFGAASHALRDSVLCYGQVGPDNIKKFIVRSQGYIGSLLSRRLTRPTSRITAPKRYDKVAIRDSSVLKTLSERLHQNFNQPSAT
jgi:hypothetical protein